MPYILIAVGAAAVLCGCRFKVPALLAFSILILIAAIVIAPFAGRTFGQTVLTAAGLVTLFQAGYLAGVTGRYALARILAPLRNMRAAKD
jgi:hypothetical protein